MKRRGLIWRLAVCRARPVGAARADGAFDERESGDRPFHDVDKAIAAGYSFPVFDQAGATCIAQPGAGRRWAVHMVNTTLLDATIDPTIPR